jgi:hypothetical protein
MDDVVVMVLGKVAAVASENWLDKSCADANDEIVVVVVIVFDYGDADGGHDEYDDGKLRVTKFDAAAAVVVVECAMPRKSLRAIALLANR